MSQTRMNRVGLLVSCAASAVIGLGLLASCGGSSPSSTPTNPAPPAASTPAPQPNPTPSAPPNVVFIMADDLDVAAISSMAQLKAHLIDKGLSFTNAFATVPLCCPSRASMLTGQYAHNHGILINRRPNTFGQEPNCFEQFRDRGAEQQTFATWLQRAGYRTGFVGKYLNRYPGDLPGTNLNYVPPGWNDWFATFSPSGNAYFNYSMNDNGTIRTYSNRPEDYLTDVETQRAVAFIHRSGANPTQPFVLIISPNAPHVPSIPARRHEPMLEGTTAARIPNFNEPDMSDKPSWFARLPPFEPDTIAALDNAQRRRLQTLLAVDEMIGEVVTALEQTGAIGNTYVIFGSDNGLLIGGHRLYLGKDAVYEESIRVPFIVRGPGVPIGRTLDHAVLNIDVAPTLAELGKAAAPSDIDGRSIVSLLHGAPPDINSWRGDFLVEHWTDQEEGLPDWFGVRDMRNQQVYVEYPSTRETEYYDLRRDPYQLDNTVSRVGSTVITPLKSRLDALRNCRGANCR